MRQVIFSLVLFSVLCIHNHAQVKDLTLTSPNGSIICTLNIRDTLKISIIKNNEVLLAPTPVYMEIRGKNTVGLKSKIKKINNKSIADTILASIPSKRKLIPDIYNELVIDFQGNVSIIARCYNDGFAFRYKTVFADSIYIINEELNFQLSEDFHCWFPELQKREGMDEFHTSFEENYKYTSVGEITENQTAYIPLLLKTSKGTSIAITESDVQDYPGMFIRGGSTGSLKAVFPSAPAEEEISGQEFKQWVVKRRTGYLAKTSGTRLFPWRVFIIAGTDRELPGNDLVYRLAEKSKIEDISWIKPGKCTDEWIIGINLFNVPFKAGLNTESYKYYIDFAAEAGIPYIMLDAGWSDANDLFKITPEMDMEEIIAYAHDKGVGLWLWTLAMTLDRQLDDALDKFSHWGITGIMTDFIDRNDQKAINFYHRIAKKTAEHRLMIMIHGGVSNAGFERTWPNALTRESVLGSEFNIWSDKVTPDHDLVLPFTRMLAGPFDYEPIVFNNSSKGTFKASHENVMTMGTRIHQLAMYVVYDSPLQIFAGNPGYAKAEPEFTRFMATIPVVWDETVIPDGQCGEYIITARRSGKDWYIAAMTNWTSRELNLDISFLGPGNFLITEYKDGINADRYAADYTVSSHTLDIKNKIKMKLAPGGGYIAKISHQQ